MSTIKVMLVDDHAIVRAGLRLLINAHPGLKVIAEASNSAEARAAAASESPDVILLDLDLGDESGLDLLPELLDAAPDARVLLLTGLKDPELHRRAILLGAMGLVLKAHPAETIIKAIEKVHSGEVWLERTMIARVLSERARPTVPQSDAEASKIALLTEREREVIALIGEGVRNKQIAQRLSISEATVRHHLTSIFAKLGISDRFELALYAYRHGLARLPE